MFVFVGGGGVGVCGCVCARALINNTFSLRRSTLKSHSARPGSDTDDVREGIQLPDIVSFWNLKELLRPPHPPLLPPPPLAPLVGPLRSCGCCARGEPRSRQHHMHGVVGRAARNCLCAAEATESGKKLVQEIAFNHLPEPPSGNLLYQARLN